MIPSTTAAQTETNPAPGVMTTKPARQPVPFWWLSGLLYISYNLCGGSKYYSALGMTAATSREAMYGGILGTCALMVSILLMNGAMLTDIDHTAVLEVPTLFLARKISFALGAVFSLILIMGIFSSCSAMLWTISEKFVTQGTGKSRLFASSVCLAAFLLGLLPFSGLVGGVYTVLGYIGLVFSGCVVYRFFTRGRPSPEDHVGDGQPHGNHEGEDGAADQSDDPQLGTHRSGDGDQHGVHAS